MTIFRKVRKDDYLQFLLLLRDFRDTIFTEEQFQTTLDTISLTSDIIVIEEDGELVATATLLYETKFIHNISMVGHIEDVCIKKSHRGKGLGKQMIDYVAQLAKKKNCYKVTLDCDDSNVEFYQKCHFEKVGNQLVMDYRC